MGIYKVKYEIDVEAHDPLEAARMAHRFIMEPDEQSLYTYEVFATPDWSLRMRYLCQVTLDKDGKEPH